MLRFAVLLIAFVCCVVTIDAVGIKRRLKEAQEQQEQSTDIPANPSGSSSSTQAPTQRGGIRRRIMESSEQHETLGIDPELPLLDSLKKHWSMGQISSARVLEYARGATAQGARGMDRMASIGSHNAFRALKSVFGIPKGAPELAWLEIPTSRGARTSHPFMMPHEFFASYFENRFDDWVATMSGPAGACLEFWQGMKDSSFLRHHPTLRSSHFQHTIPIGMHGDAGAFSHQDSLYSFSWNSLVGRGPTASKRFLFTVIRKSEMVEGTLDALFRAFAWSVNILLEGTWPKKTYHGRLAPNGGERLASGWKAALCQARGDWAFYTEVFGIPAWNCAERMCWLCRASSTISELAWTQSGPRAGWRKTRWSHEAYLEYLRAAGIAIPVLLIAILGFRLECIMVDTLHTVDQGVASHIVGNICWEFAARRRSFGTTNIDDGIKALDAHLRSWYASRKTLKEYRLQGKLTPERLRAQGKWPKLKAKAASTRHLAKYVLHLVQSFGGPEDRDLLALCQLLDRFYTIIANESMFMSTAACTEIAKLGQRLAVIYASLAESAARKKVKMWKMMPKLHLFVHLCEWQAGEVGNPRFYWTYADEDLVGLLVEVAETCHPQTMAASALFKWMHVYYQ